MRLYLCPFNPLSLCAECRKLTSLHFTSSAQTLLMPERLCPSQTFSVFGSLILSCCISQKVSQESSAGGPSWIHVTVLLSFTGEIGIWTKK